MCSPDLDSEEIKTGGCGGQSHPPSPSFTPDRREGLIAIYRNQDGSWGVDYRDEFGIRKRVRVGTKQAAERIEAMKAMDRAQAQARRRLIESQQSITLKDAIDVYLTTKPDRASTIKSQRGQFASIRKVLGEEKLQAITPQMLKAYLALRATQLSPTTLAFEKRLIRHLFKTVQEYGFSALNPAAGITGTTSILSNARALTRDEELAVISAANQSKLPRIMLGLDAGAHTVELTVLRAHHFNFQSGTVTFPPTKTVWRHRTLPLTGRLLTVMEEHCAVTAAGNGPEAPLFPTSRPTNFLAGFRHRVGIHFRFHDLRHTFAHRLTQAGAPEQIISRALGHAPRSTTAIYTGRHVNADDIRPYVERMEQLAELHQQQKLTPKEETTECQERDTTSESPRDLGDE